MYNESSWSVQFGRSVVSDSVTSWTAVCQAALSITNFQSLLKLMFECVMSVIECVMPSNHLILCHPLLLCLQSFPASGSFPVSQWPEYWSFSFSISPSNEYSGLIPFRMDLFDLLAVQGTLKSLLQHHNSKASTLGHSTFFMVQLSHADITTGKTIVLTIQIFISKVIALLLNTLSRFVIAFLPRSKYLLIS